jgi:hypothetical protein
MFYLFYLFRYKLKISLNPAKDDAVDYQRLTLVLASFALSNGDVPFLCK